jgi:hypothetical protein
MMNATEVRRRVVEGYNVPVAALARAAGYDRSNFYGMVRDGRVQAIRLGKKSLRVPPHEARRVLGIED